MKVTNNSKALQGVRGDDGRAVYVPPSESRDVVLSGDALKRAKRLSFLSISGKEQPVKDSGNGSGNGSGTENPPTSGYTVTDKGSGWFAITQDGKEVTKSLRKDDVAGFADLDADGQAKFVADNKAE